MIPINDAPYLVYSLSGSPGIILTDTGIESPSERFTRAPFNVG